jgi:predicted SAM-dependent methyltransferase
MIGFGGKILESLIQRADKARDETRWQDAIDLYKTYLSKRPWNGGIYVELGYCLRRAGQLDTADKALRRAVWLSPRLAPARLQLGHLRKQQGRLPEAINCYRDALKRNPALTEAINELANMRADTAETEPRRLWPGIFRAPMLRGDDRLDELEQRNTHITRQVGILLEQHSIVRALGVESARQRKVVDELVQRMRTSDAALDNRIAPLEKTTAKIMSHFEKLLEQLAVVRSLSVETRRLRESYSGLEASLNSGLESGRESYSGLEASLNSGLESGLGQIEMRVVARHDSLAGRVNRIGKQFDDRIGELDLSVSDRLGVVIKSVSGIAATVSALEQKFPSSAPFDKVQRRMETIEGELANLVAMAQFDARLHAHSGAIDTRFDDMGQKIEARIAHVCEDIAQLQDMKQQLGAAIAQSLPTSRFESFAGQANDMLRYLTGRIEFVRREILYEFYHGRQMNGAAAQSLAGTLVAEPIVKSPEKIETARERGLALNVGCGHIALDGFINVDRRDLPGVDVVAEADALPFQPATVAHIHSAHLLEHFPEEALKRTLLPHWKDLLGPGGRLTAVVPDGKAMLAHYAEGTYPFSEFREVLFGAQDYVGDYHYNLLTPESLTELLREAGFDRVRINAEGRRNGSCYEFEIEGYSNATTRPETPMLQSRGGRSRKRNAKRG